MRCPICGGIMDVIDSDDNLKWWTCRTCRNEEPFTEFDEEDEHDSIDRMTGYWRRLEEDE